MKPLVIVGAGPVGLFLACLLAARGVELVVLERREENSGSSASARSIGLHPPALEALDSIGSAAGLIECGVEIRRARVYDEGDFLGSLSLERCPGPFPFVLSLPQGVVERLLEERLATLAPGALRRAAKVDSVAAGSSGAELRLADGQIVEAGFVVGCDGHRSTVRRALAGAAAGGGPSRHHYLMADLPESSELEHDAAIYLGWAGVVESFPLPGSRRRWVARVGDRPVAAEFEQLWRAVADRTGERLPSATDDETSHFTAESYLAPLLAGERWALAGDAAHVVSPIGGQGMNLGLLGAAALIEAGLGESWRPERYQGVQLRRARRATRRARLNMALGSGRMPLMGRRAVLRTLLNEAVADRAARYFTMRGL